MKPPKDDLPPGYEFDCFCIPSTTLLSHLKLLLPCGTSDDLWEEARKTQDLESELDEEKAKIERCVLAPTPI